MPTRRNFMALAGAAGLSAGLGRSARAQSTVDGWPSRSGAGDLADRDRRTGPEFPPLCRQSEGHVRPELRAGEHAGRLRLDRLHGGGALGADGHTILLASNSLIVLAPLVISGNPVNVKRDFDPIALMFTFPFLLVVNPDLGVKTLKELVDYAKARPGVLNWGSPGIGTGGHLVTELLLKQTGIQGQHVPYAGTTQQLLATAAGTLQFTFDTPGNSKGVVDAGKVIALAVTGDKRSDTAPEVPTFKELGYDGFDDLRVSNGLLAPKRHVATR